MAKKRRVPEVLWRLFRNRARTLAHTIISLISQSPPLSLRCGMPLSFLIQPDDPSDYRKLLNQSFAVVNENAPPLSGFSPDTRWSQLQIVERAIEMVMSEQSISSNVICTGYEEGKDSGFAVELLTGPAWDLLLKRVGDVVMIYLLKNTSIFLPLPPKKHYQITGPPINDLCHKLSKLKGKSQCRHRSLVQFGPQKKRKIVDNASSKLERQQASSPFSVGCNPSSISCVGFNNRTYVKQISKHPGHNNSQMSIFEADALKNGVGFNNKTYVKQFRKHPGYNNGQMSVFEADALKDDAVVATYKGDSDGEIQQSFSEITTKSGKHLRPFRWQRHRNNRQINLQQFTDKIPRKTVRTDGARLCGRLQYDFNKRMQQKCCCCLMLQAPQLVTFRDYINRHSMFYSSECSSTMLPHQHILYSLKPNFSGSKFLIESIFGLSDVNMSPHSKLCFHSSGFHPIGSACLYQSLVRLLKILIRRSQRCQHLRLLDKHCVLPSLDQKAMENSSSLLKGTELANNVCKKSHVSCTKHCKKTVEAGNSQFEAIKPYCLKSQVVSFVWAVCRSIIPPALLGTPSNWRALRRNISKFIRLRRFEKFSVKQCTHKLKTSEFPFLSNKYSSCNLNAQVLKDASGQNVIMHKELSKLSNAMVNMKQKLLANWIFWLFSCVVVPLVQSNFYVTESEHGKLDIYYYRKSVWENLTNKTITCLDDKNYIQLDDAGVRSFLSNRSFGFSKLRLRPKENGVRMLANLKASSRMMAEKDFKCKCSRQKDAQLHQHRFKSVNFVLRDIHSVLKGLMLKEPDKLGSSVFDYNDVYRKLCPFLIGLRNNSTTIPGVFIVVSDVSRAFDSIDQDKLLSVMNDIILEDTYLLEQSAQVVCTKNSLWVHDKFKLMDHNISTCYTTFSSSITFPSLHSILLNQGRSRYVRKEELFFNLNEHVKCNVLQLGKKFYLQGIGIPQGSVISSLLCSLYYGELERNVLYPFLEKIRESAIEVVPGIHNSGENSNDDKAILSPSYMLLRFIDDFLFISTSKKQATNFFDRLQRGFRDYNCYMNEEKFCANFDIRHKSGLLSKRVYVGEDGISFLRWSGLLINCSTSEVQGDYTRYWNNHLRSTLTVRWQDKPGHHLKKRLHAFMRPKCHPIFFDSNINSAAVVRLNVYQVFLLCAMKFHCYISDLSYICKLCSSSYKKAIQRSFRYMFVLIKKRMHSLNLGPNLQPILQLEEEEVEWLGLNAYVQVLKRKQSRHKELLSVLRSKLLAHRITATISSQFEYAVDKSHSSMIWKIKY